MALVHKQPVYAQFFKGDYIVLALGSPQFFELQFKLLARFLHLLDGKFLPGGMFQLGNAALDLVDLFLDDALLPLKGKRNFLKLAVPDDDRIVIPSGDAGAELLSVGGFKILFGRHQ